MPFSNTPSGRVEPKRNQRVALNGRCFVPCAFALLHRTCLVLLVDNERREIRGAK
jgi:hypothetical protein